MSNAGEEVGRLFEELHLRSWPRRDHDLLASSGQDGQHAFLGWYEGVAGRTRGFRRAAEVLAQAMLAGGDHRDLDTVVFPFANCWRHYVELQLKQLVEQCDALLVIEPRRRRGGHNIVQLWSELRPLLRRVFPNEEDENLAVVCRIIGQLAALDPDNQNFRYSQRRDGTEPFANVPHLDVWQFHGAMVAVANYLEVVESAIDHKSDIKQEYLAYMWELAQDCAYEVYGYEQ